MRRVISFGGGLFLGLVLGAVIMALIFQAFTGGCVAFNWNQFSLNQADCVLIGFRSTDGHITGVKKIGYAGTCDTNAIRKGLPLQEFMTQLTNDKTVFPSGFDLSTSLTYPKYEGGNDSLNGIAFRSGWNTWTYYQLPRTPGDTVPFWKASYIQLTDAGLLICEDDDGVAGTWEGHCSKATQIVPASDINSYATANAEVQELIGQIKAQIARHYGKPDQPIHWTNVWFPQ
jgi:hypothetical protein